MAAKLARRPRIAYRQVSGGPSPALVRMRQALAARASRARRESASRQGLVVAALAAGAWGYADRKGVAFPTVRGVEPSLLIGGLAAFAAGSLVKGNTGKMLGDAATGVLAIAAYRYGSGQAGPMGSLNKVSGDEELEGEWEDIP